MTGLQLDFDARPSATAYMLRALYPGFLRKAPPFPPLRARWKAARPDPARLGRFLGITGLGANRGLPVPYPQVFTFPLQMALLTHPACPLPIWKVLQIRNHLMKHRAIPVDSTLDAEASVASQRILEKGMELDIHVTLGLGEEIAWEGLSSYYYRGRFGDPGPASPLATPPIEPTSEVARWRTDPGGGLRFGGVSGDYNGIHFSGAYARLFGFRGAFHHPHALVGQILSRLAEPRADAQRLDLWLKGPVYYGSEVGLTAREEGARVEFALTARGNDRPALLGCWSELMPGNRLAGAGGEAAG